MFQTQFRKLREAAGYKSQQAFADAFGVPQSTVGGWESGKRYPRRTTLIRLAQFSDVSIDELLGNADTNASEEKDQKSQPLVNADEGLTEYLEELRTRPEMRMLFSISKGATKEDVEKAVAIIEALRRTEGRG